MSYDPNEHVPTLGRDLAGLALWCALMVGLLAGGASPSVGIQSGAGPMLTEKTGCSAPATSAGARIDGTSASAAAD
jgi:hypothetical protein